jgi:hypothetical protein
MRKVHYQGLGWIPFRKSAVNKTVNELREKALEVRTAHREEVTALLDALRHSYCVIRTLKKWCYDSNDVVNKRVVRKLLDSQGFKREEE